jgi:DNA-binding transcriptional ArsR family regulator
MIMSISAFATLADPTRRRLVDELRLGERSVSALVEAVPISQSGVSRHLRILREAGFVQVRAAGQERLYSLRPERFRELDEWLARYRQLWEQRLDRFGAELERRRSGSSGRPQTGSNRGGAPTASPSPCTSSTCDPAGSCATR